VQLHLPAVEEVLEEHGERAAPPRRVVADAVGVEEAQDGALQAALLDHPQREVLVEVLRRRVGPAPRRRRAEHDRVVLRERRLRLPVDVRGGGEHDVRPRLEPEREGGVRAVDVDLERLERPAVAGDLHRREVGDRVAVAERVLEQGRVAAVELVEGEARVPEHPLEVAEVAHREVVDADDLHAFGEQPLGEICSDEAGCSRYADPSREGHAALLCSGAWGVEAP
jgi:hypothetical protein